MIESIGRSLLTSSVIVLFLYTEHDYNFRLFNALPNVQDIQRNESGAIYKYSTHKYQQGR